MAFDPPHRLRGAPARTAPDNFASHAPEQSLGKKKPRVMRGQFGLPTKEPSGAVGHPFVEFGFLTGCQPHELLGSGVAHELFHLLGFLRLLELGETGDTLVAGFAVEKSPAPCPFVLVAANGRSRRN